MLTTPNSADSKWMPWECGYVDGLNGKAAVLPITNDGSDNYRGQEYLGVYPYVTRTGVSGTLYIRESVDVWCPFAVWLAGGKPTKH